MGYVSMAQDVVSLLDRMGIERCCVIGHSMGGKHSLCYIPAGLSVRRGYGGPGSDWSVRVDSVAILDIAPADYSKVLGKVLFPFQPSSSPSSVFLLFFSCLTPASAASAARLLGPLRGSETWRDIAVTINSLYGLPLQTVKDKKHADELLAASIQDPLLRAFALTNLVKEDQGGRNEMARREMRRMRSAGMNMCG
eukprot:763522-Hanusia_phi.AAC.6